MQQSLVGKPYSEVFIADAVGEGNLLLITRPQLRSSTMEKLSFFEAVHALVRCIPPGRVTTYGALAHALGAKSSARMVGWAMHQAVKERDVPAHRVVNRYGLLTGQHHFVGERTMEQLLASEGISVLNNQVQAFEKHFWDPKEVASDVR